MTVKNYDENFVQGVINDLSEEDLNLLIGTPAGLATKMLCIHFYSVNRIASPTEFRNWFHEKYDQIYNSGLVKKQIKTYGKQHFPAMAAELEKEGIIIRNGDYSIAPNAVSIIAEKYPLIDRFINVVEKFNPSSYEEIGLLKNELKKRDERIVSLKNTVANLESLVTMKNKLIDQLENKITNAESLKMALQVFMND